MDEKLDGLEYSAEHYLQLAVNRFSQPGMRTMVLYIDTGTLKLHGQCSGN